MKKSIFIFTFLLFNINLNASIPVSPIPIEKQEHLLKSHDPKLAENKKLVYDFYRIILYGLRLEQVPKYMREDYIQHNPNVETGMNGFIDFFKKLGGPRTIPNFIANLVSIQAEGDYVTMSFVNNRQTSGSNKESYTTTWFDMFRIQDGKIAEHWDCDTK